MSPFSPNAMHIFCNSCSNHFILDQGSPDREVACRWCGSPLNIRGGRPEQETWAEQLVEELRTGNRSERLQALSGLIHLGPSARKSLPLLLGMLGETRTRDSARLVAAIGAVSATPVTPELESPLNEKDIEQLRPIEPPSEAVVRGLKEAFDADVEDLEVRSAVITAFANFAKGASYSKRRDLDWETVYDVLCRGLEDEFDEVRMKAARAIGWLGRCCSDDHMVDHISEAFDAEDNPGIRRELVWALAWICVPPEAVLPTLIRALDDEVEEVAYTALERLSKLGPGARPAVPAIVNMLKSGGPDEWEHLQFILCKIGPNEDSVLDVAEGLDNDDPKVVRFAAELLGYWGHASASAVPLLISKLRHREAEVVGAVAEALGEIGAGAVDALPTLVELLADARWEDKATILTALGGIGPAAKPALPHLIANLKAEDDFIRRAAADAVSKVDPKGDSVVPEIQSLRDVSSAEPEAKLFRRDGSLWMISFGGLTNRFKESKGLKYLHYLISHPCERVHVVRLHSAIAGPPDVRVTKKNLDEIGDNYGKEAASNGFTAMAISDGEPIFDGIAISRMQREMRDLEGQLSKAQEDNDSAKVVHLQEQIDALERFGLSKMWLGNSKRVGSDADRIRKSVAKCIRASLKEIKQANPELWRHLDDSISTGYFCVYDPSPSVRWEM